MTTDELFMRRALQLARMGEGFTSPNPIVGAVIVARGRVIGQGYHRRCGGPHAEVWAVRSVAQADVYLLKEATVYVTLEPCSHYGKTPPCADMLVRTGVKRVVVGCLDPNPKVSGRGVRILRDAGVDVVTDVLRDECFNANRRFMVAQLLKRPYVLLKWASSADGYLDAKRLDVHAPPVKFSTPLSLQSMHAVRALCDAIMVGAGTVIADDPSLTIRFATGLQPRPVIMDRRGCVPDGAKLFQRPGAIYVTSNKRSDLPVGVMQIIVSPDASISEVLEALRAQGISSIMVEGGAELLTAFIETNQWDDARVEVAPCELGERGVGHVDLPQGIITTEQVAGGNVIINVKKPRFVQ
ncbi:MAG: bifunctional diaminohydroxyphosphoribosylaminopyrimidine deaminase/5-amino-6-(5-phosphoribosylamino)uracil reductase RibD [Firmicutes bacterium]|nr:bifunctional diaminohydroxyphosphoribosylaminopyrimidine deaminase/5-amino-6-(5-phosphoribosylamino)uracil reductase RibD [Bacillota bacterium]MCM1401622.1 bifunctional diaminohydroxyphosphoribosylaminopyrimidine deaminase/5-amino-6-(5-phosphoribosylamino)uracil reductase RibD [Bacteroides sp.]MCM1477798.1 bifunctional diaminohydroxyphosphoribosylaminopyrimidine deaminase/5-amino-6-(5-phosphoribosylamino)uracil reductase RibD [Bacteroides sp.]